MDEGTTASASSPFVFAIVIPAKAGIQIAAAPAMLARMPDESAAPTC